MEAMVTALGIEPLARLAAGIAVLQAVHVDHGHPSRFPAIASQSAPEPQPAQKQGGICRLMGNWHRGGEAIIIALPFLFPEHLPGIL